MIGALGVPVARIAAALDEVTSATALSVDDLLPLLVAGVKVTDLLDYVRAAASNRLN